MRRRFIITASMILLSFILWGCSSIPRGSYFSVSPYEEKNQQEPQTMATPKSYEDVVYILKNMLFSYTESQTFSVEDMEKDWQTYLQMAVDALRNTNPLGAYLIEDVRYESGLYFGIPTVSVKFEYSNKLTEINKIKNVETMEEAEECIYEALNAIDSGVTIQVDKFEQRDYTQLVLDYAMRFPQYVMEVPSVSVRQFPQTGDARIIEISFSYTNSREVLSKMQNTVAMVYFSIQNNVGTTGSTNQILYRLYDYLENLNTYQLQTSITPAYSLIHYGVGDSRAIASVFASLCRSVGLDCEMVMGTRDGYAWCWNVLRSGDVFYHIDLFSCLQNGEFAYYKPEDMTNYVWDYSNFE